MALILRVLEGIDLTGELKSLLNENLNEYTIEYFRHKPNYRQSIEQRINSLHEAFNFILDSYPPDFSSLNYKKETFIRYAQNCRNKCALDNKESLNDLHHELEVFTSQLIQVLSVYWKWKDKKEIIDSIECLNEAEQYMLMSRGRPDIATLIPAPSGDKTEFILQKEISLPAHYPLFLQELTAIKENGYPVTPRWYRKLPEYQQAFFCHLDPSMEPSQIKQDFDTFFTETWATIKSNSLNISSDLRQIHNDEPPFPGWFNDLKPPFQSLFHVLSAHPDSVDLNLAQLKMNLDLNTQKIAFKQALNQILAIPQWYWVLSEMQQAFLTFVLRTANNIEEAFSSLSSRHRTLPLPANLGYHELIRIQSDTMKSLYGKRYFSAHLGSRDAEEEHYPQEVKKRHIDSNLDKIASYSEKDQLIFLQTLISPIFAIDSFSEAAKSVLPESFSEAAKGLLPKLPPDLSLYHLLRAAINRSERSSLIHHTNHPQNVAKRVYYTQSDDPDSLRLIDACTRFSEFVPGLEDLINDYKDVLNSPWLSASFQDYDGRELYLSSLEQLMILSLGGFSYGSCVSAKDRKSCELIHTDAMIYYKELYGTWPKFGYPKTGDERKNFVAIFVEFYISRNRHALAALNAPGSAGIKTPHRYLPNDICEAIRCRLGDRACLANDDKLASDNEVKCICPSVEKNFIPIDRLNCLMTAIELGEETCTALYDALSAFIQQVRSFVPLPARGFWSSLFGGKSHAVAYEAAASEAVAYEEAAFDYSESLPNPQGIREIRALMGNKDTGGNNITRMEKIFAIVLSRSKEDNTRSSGTNSIYDHIRRFFAPIGPGDNLQVRAENAIKVWKEKFEKSKDQKPNNIENETLSTIKCSAS